MPLMEQRPSWTPMPQVMPGVQIGPQPTILASTAKVQPTQIAGPLAGPPVYAVQQSPSYVPPPVGMPVMQQTPSYVPAPVPGPIDGASVQLPAGFAAGSPSINTLPQQTQTILPAMGCGMQPMACGGQPPMGVAQIPGMPPPVHQCGAPTYFGPPPGQMPAPMPGQMLGHPPAIGQMPGFGTERGLQPPGMIGVGPLQPPPNYGIVGFGPGQPSSAPFAAMAMPCGQMPPHMPCACGQRYGPDGLPQVGATGMQPGLEAMQTMPMYLQPQ